MVDKIDLRKELKRLYAPSASKVEVVDVPAFKFIAIDGKIEPGQEPATSASFQEAFGALYGAVYTAKFALKLRKSDPIDFTIMPLEGLWWTDGGEFDMTAKDKWQWTLKIMVPDVVTEEVFSAALEQLEKKKPSAALARLRLERFQEGLSMQIMHVGPYATEPATIEKMHAFARENGYRPRGAHHEIYFGDPRRTAPEKLKTILRQPIEKV